MRIFSIQGYINRQAAKQGRMKHLRTEAHENIKRMSARAGYFCQMRDIYSLGDPGGLSTAFSALPLGGNQENLALDQS
jgi:hypothetical protein